MRSQLRLSAAALALVATGTLVAGKADAQVANESQQSEVGLGDIVVTAQKRTQSLNDVPISVSVASAAQLQSAGISDATDLGLLVPGFTASTSVFGPPVFSLRGVNFNSFQASAPPTVSSYIDEAALPYPIMGQALFLDVERVEVLKGPQGTLFGQNATGGSINVIAAKPTDSLSAGVKLDVNQWGETTAEGFVSGPISDTLRGRVAAQTTQFGGWQRGYFNNDQKNGSQDKFAGRVLLDWTPTDKLTVGLNLNGSRDRSEQQQAQAFLFRPAVPAAPTAAPFLAYASRLPNDARDADFDLGFDTKADSHNLQAVVRADYEVTDALTVTSITNYIDTKFRSPHDQDGTAVPMQQGTAKADIESINQELRLAGDYSEQGLNFVLGFSYGDDDITEGVFNNYAGYTGFPANSPAEWRYGLTQKATAVFGSVDYELVPSLTLTLGARYTDTSQSINGCTFDRGGGGIAGTAGFLAGLFNPAASASYVPGGCITINDTDGSFLPTAVNRKQKEDNTAWRAALNYRPTDDVTLYGSVSRGYKAGTFPVIIQLFDSAIQPVKQEELTSYEVGTKLSLLDRKLQLNAAAFHYDYVDKQFFSFLPVFPGLVTATLVNIPKSKVDGFEFDVTAQPTEGLRITGGATYIKTEVKDYIGFDFAGAPLDFSGKEFNYSPPWSVNLDAEYTFPVGDGLDAFVGGSLTYRDSTFADLGENPEFGMPSYTLLDARIGLAADDGWRISIYGRNLTDEYYWNSVASAGDGAVRFTGEPQTFGANFSYQF